MVLQSVQHGKPSLLRPSIQEGNMAKNRKKKRLRNITERVEIPPPGETE